MNINMNMNEKRSAENFITDKKKHEQPSLQHLLYKQIFKEMVDEVNLNVEVVLQ